ncbi:MAG: hypothetical protein K0Q94_4372 [Paenibacillus sp.]|jgi:hypothetical protein|uniref:hypothetical protein n=1 Tax=Paenibacillus sp. GCM10012303 TaxID=3317340 RepID=UPI0029F04739|nr:hypothetical protein [Paenibacillus sp.]
MDWKQAGERNAAISTARGSRKRSPRKSERGVRGEQSSVTEIRLLVTTGSSGRASESAVSLPPRGAKAEPALEPTVVTTALPGQAGEAKPAGTVTYVGAGFWTRTVKPDGGTVRMAA